MSDEKNGDMMPTSAMWGLVIYCGVYVVSSMEAVPGWGLFNLGLPTWLWIAAMGVAGINCGALVLDKQRAIGAVGGLIAGLGSILFVVQLMQKADEVRIATLVMAGMIGALPGIGLAAFASWIAGRRSVSG